MPTVDCGELLRYFPQLDKQKAGSPILHMAIAEQLKLQETVVR
jgi:hypothetical protein